MTDWIPLAFFALRKCEPDEPSLWLDLAPFIINLVILGAVPWMIKPLEAKERGYYSAAMPPAVLADISEVLRKANASNPNIRNVIEPDYLAKFSAYIADAGQMSVAVIVPVLACILTRWNHLFQAPEVIAYVFASGGSLFLYAVLLLRSPDPEKYFEKAWFGVYALSSKVGGAANIVALLFILAGRNLHHSGSIKAG